jgi:protein SCO1/2
MFYAGCPAACPLLVSDTQRIESRLSKEARERVRFPLVSFDSQHDSPATLRGYAVAHGLDLRRWTLLTGNADDVRELAAIVGLQYRREKDGSYVHSNVITVLDADGVIRHQQHGLHAEPAPAVEALEKLVAKRE